MKTLNIEYNITLDNFKFSDEILYVNFGDNYNLPIDNTVFPKFLLSISFGKNFNQSLNNVKFPNTLQSIIFHNNNVQTINNTYFPPSLMYISFYGINVDILTLPLSINTVYFGNGIYNIDLVIKMPKLLRKIIFDTDYTNIIEHIDFPDSLEIIKIYKLYTPLINLPPSLKELHIYHYDNNKYILEQSKIPYDCKIIYFIHY